MKPRCTDLCPASRTIFWSRSTTSKSSVIVASSSLVSASSWGKTAVLRRSNRFLRSSMPIAAGTASGTSGRAGKARARRGQGEERRVSDTHTYTPTHISHDELPPLPR